jgi:hypothetical protein
LRLPLAKARLGLVPRLTLFIGLLLQHLGSSASL